MRLVLLLVVSACTPASVELGGDDSGKATGDDTGLTTFPDACPNVLVSESELIWSGVPVGSASSRTVTVTNACTGVTTLALAAHVEGDGAFTVVSDSDEIDAGARATLTVTFTPPTSGDSAGTLYVETNDPDEPLVTVALAGTVGEDGDGDGFSAVELGGEDCDDTNANINPNAEEVWYDGVDENCDGLSDYDQDGDGADATAYGGADCDDLDTAVGPDAPEVQNLEDEDCDGWIDEDFVTAGSIVVNEIMHHPLHVADTDGEWFEVRNTTNYAIDLVNWTISADDGDSFTIDATTVVDAGGVAVLGINGASATNGGASIDYVYSRDEMSLSSDDSLILTQAGEVVFDMEWTTAWYDAEGTSMSLDPDHASWSEARTSNYWCPAKSLMSAGDRGTPGAANDDCTNIDEDRDGYSVDAGDCDDDDATVSPGASDVWNGIDDNCDGSIDDATVSDVMAGYVDGPANGYLGYLGGLGVGDLTGDSSPDLLVGGTAIHNSEGAVYLIDGDDAGSLGGDAEDFDTAVVEGATLNYLGATSQVAGDNTGDGLPDLVVAGTEYSTYYGDVTAAVFAGGGISGSLDSGDADFVISGSSSYAPWNRVVSDADVNGDGVDEVIVTEPGTQGTGYGTYGGRVWVVDVSAGVDIDVDDALAGWDGPSTYDMLGSGAAAGDFDGDGYAEVVFGMSGDDTEGDNAGAWFFVDGSSTFSGSGDIDDAADRVMYGDTDDMELGANTPAIADFDGDGKVDFATGSALGEEVYVFYHLDAFPASIDNGDADTTISGDPGSTFGFALTSGDFDGDGRADLAVGAPASTTGYSSYGWNWAYYYYTPGTDYGAVYFFSGGSFSGASYDAAAAAGATLTGETSGDLFGATLSGGADFDGDGDDDLLVGATRGGTARNAGRVYVVLGG